MAALLLPLYSFFFLIPFLVSRISAECGCTSDESCCADTKGYSCCIDQTSFCVTSTGDPVYGYPARCCPQWTVGCSVGSVGCCDPAQPWQRSIEKAGVAEQRPPVQLHPRPPLGDNATVTAYALFSGGHGSGGSSDLNCLTIDAATGIIVNMVSVSGPAVRIHGPFFFFSFLSWTDANLRARLPRLYPPFDPGRLGILLRWLLR